MSKGMRPPTIPVIVEHMITDEGLTLCSGHEWKRSEVLNVAKWFCPLCTYLIRTRSKDTP